MPAPFVPERRYGLQNVDHQFDEAVPQTREFSPSVPSETNTSSNTANAKARPTESRRPDDPSMSSSGCGRIGLNHISAEQKQPERLLAAGDTSSEEWTDDEEFYSRSARQKHRQQRLIERQKTAALELCLPADARITHKTTPVDDPIDEGPLSIAFQRRVAAAAMRSPRASRFQVNPSVSTPSCVAQLHRHAVSPADSVVDSPQLTKMEVLPSTRGYESSASDADIEDGDID